MKKLMICTIIVVLMLPNAALAASPMQQQAEALDTEAVEGALYGEGAEIMDGQSIDTVTDGGVIENFIKSFRDNIAEIIKNSIMSAALLILAAVLCSAASSVVKADMLGGFDYISLVGVIAVAALSFGGVRNFVAVAGGAMDEMSSFAKVLLPTLTAAASAGGTAASASAKYAIATMFMSFMISAVNGLIFPLIYAYLAAGIASAAFGGDGLQGACALIKWAATGILTVTVLVFTVYITVSGVVSGTADAGATRMAKTVLSTALPIVGSIISDAAATVVTGAETLKNAIGVFGLFAVAAICFLPFLRLGVNYIVYKAAAMLAHSVAGSNISKAIDCVSTAIGISLGAAGACAVMLFFAVISVIKAVGAV